jgi:transposase
MLQNNKAVWEKVRIKRAKLIPKSNEWNDSIKLEKEISRTQSKLEALICEYEVKERLGWVNAYLKIKNARKTGEVFGISEHTVRKWVRKHRKYGIDGLKTVFKPIFSEMEENWIRELYNEGFSSKGIQNELKKRYGFIIDNTKLLRKMRTMILPLPNPKQFNKSKPSGN